MHGGPGLRPKTMKEKASKQARKEVSKYTTVEIFSSCKQAVAKVKPQGVGNPVQEESSLDPKDSSLKRSHLQLSHRSQEHRSYRAKVFAKCEDRINVMCSA